MPTPPDFTNGTALEASSLNSVGLWLVKTQTIGTAVSSVTVSNAFSATYDNYKIIISGGDASAVGTLNFNFDGATTNYRWSFSGSNYDNTASLGGLLGDTLFRFAGFASTIDYVNMNMDVISPFASTPSQLSTVVTGSIFAGKTVGIHSTAASYTGFVVAPASGTLTGGTIRVYGYRN